MSARDEWSRLVRATLPSAWAEENLLLKIREGEPSERFALQGREFVADVMDDLSLLTSVMAGAQVGKTVLALGRIFWTLDQDARDVLFVMPRDRDVSDFSAGRFSATKDASPSIADLFSGADNVTHKVTRNGANLYLRGAQSTPGLKSIPVSLVVLDEFDEMLPAAASLARERTSAQAERWVLQLSTPTLRGIGIDREFSASDRRRWQVPCPVCAQAAPLKWPESLCGDLMGPAAQVGWRCVLCAEPWTEAEKRAAVSGGWWLAENPASEHRGYHMPQLLSPIRLASDFAARWKKAQETAEEYQNFYRSVLGEPYVPAGVRIDDAMVEDAFRAGPSESAAGPPKGAAVTFGVDVGVNHHFVEVASWAGDGFKTVLLARIVRNFDEIYDLVRRFRPRTVVVDANPNTEAARAFQNRLGNSVWLAFYAKGMLEPIRWHPENGTVSINRTEILDKVVSRFMARRVGVPRDAPAEYMPHHRALQRVVEMNEAKGNEEARYESSGADHFAHAAAYNEVAGTSLPDEDPGRDWPQDRADDVSTRGEARRIEKALVTEEGWPQDLTGDLS
jgi:hypothetical protein